MEPQNAVQYVRLEYVAGKSSKFYRVWIERTDPSNNYKVMFNYGRIGAVGNFSTKTPNPVSLYAAEQIYHKIILEKKAKGYEEVADGSWAAKALPKKEFSAAPTPKNSTSKKPKKKGGDPPKRSILV